MGAVITTVLSTIAQVVPYLTNSASIQNVINMLTQVVPTIIKEVADVKPYITNIIDALKGNSAVTEEQWAQLDALSKAADDAFEAEATQFNADGSVKTTS